MSQGPDVGGAWIEIHADGDGLPEEIQAVVTKAAKKAKAKITLDPKLASDWRAKVQALINSQKNPEQPLDPTLAPGWSEKTKSQTKRQKPAPVPVEPDIDKEFRQRLQAQVQAATRKIEADIPITPQGENFRRELRVAVEGLIQGINAEVPLDPVLAAGARAELLRKIKVLEAQAKADPVEIPVDVDRDASASIQRLIADLGGRGGGGGGGLAGAVRGVLKTFASIPAAVASVSTLAPVLGGATAAVVALAAALSTAAGAAIPAGVALSSLALGGLALKVGFTGVGDALDASAKAAAELAANGKVSAATAEALDAALKNLSPSAREVVSALRGVSQQFEGIRKQVQQSLFAGLGKEVVQVGKVFLPILRSSLVGIAGVLNEAALGFLQFIRSGENSGRIKTILDGLEPILANILSIAKPLTDAFLRIFEKSLPFAQQIAAAIATGADNFARFIGGATKSGAFTDFLKTAMDFAKQLFDIIRNVGSIIGSVFQAGQQAGGGLLGVIKDLTGDLANFLKSAQGKEALGNFFGLIAIAAGTVSQAFQVLSPLLSAIGTVFKTLQGPVKALQAALLPLVEILAVVLADALTTIAPLFAQLIVALTPLVSAIGQGLVLVFTALVQALIPLIPVIVQMATVFAAQLVPIITQIAPILAQLVTTFGQLLLAIAPNSAAFLQLIAAMLPLIPPLLTLILKLAQIGVVVANVVVPAISQVIGGFTRITTVIVNVIVSVVNFVNKLLSGFASAKKAVQDAVTAIVGILGDLAQRFNSSFRTAVDAAVKVLSELISKGKEIGGKILDAIVGALKGLGSKLFDIGSLKSAAQSAVSAIVGAFDGIGGKILSKVQGLAGKIASAITPNIKIPGLAKGGVVAKPTLIAAGERTPELVVPISPNAPLNPGVEALLAQVAAARAGGTTATPTAGVQVTQNISLPTGDPEAAALAVLDGLAAVL